MPDPDRLEELRRQRDRLREALDRTEDEIAALLRTAAPDPPPAQGAAPRVRPSDEEIAAEADALIEKFAQPTAVGSGGWKAGCWAAFAMLLLAVVLGTLALYLGYYR